MVLCISQIKLEIKLIKVTILVESLQTFKRLLIQQITVYYCKNQNTMVFLLRILIIRSSFFQLMVTNQMQLMSNIGCLKVPYSDLFCFFIYIDDLHVAIKYSEVHHFADGTNLLNFNSCLKSINKQVNYDLKKTYQIG